ncbi:retrovirus-related pol polyprotein from transposon TNT 1-94 [Tanacetum coccineum]
MVPETPLQFGVAERLSRTFRAESTGLRAEAPKMLWADSVSTTYLIYHIPYVSIGLRIPEEEWQGGSDEVRYNFWDTKSHQVIRSRDITFMDSIHETSLGGSSDTSEGFENSGSFEDSGRSDEEYSEDGASSKEGGSETPQVRRSNIESKAPVRYSPSANYFLLKENGELESYLEALSSKESIQWKKAIIEEIVSLEKNQTYFLVRISAGKKASQRLWMFKVKEEQNGRKRYKARLVVKGFQQKHGVDYNEIFSPVVKMTRISEGFQLAGQEENLECRLKEIMYGLIQAPRLRVLIFVEDSWNEEPCNDVHQVGDEIEVEVLRNFNWPPSELITEDGVLPERGYSQFNDVSSGYLDTLYRKSPSPAFGWCSVFRMFGGTKSALLDFVFMGFELRHVIVNELLGLVDDLSAWNDFSWVQKSQSLGGSSDTSEGFENSGSFEDSGRSDEEYSEDGASSKEGGSETPQVRRSNIESKAPVRNREWQKKRYKADGTVKGFQQKHGVDYNEIFSPVVKMTRISEGFQLAGQEENLECRLKEIMYGLIQAPRLRYLKFNSFMQNDKALTWQNSTSLSGSCP